MLTDYIIRERIHAMIASSSYAEYVTDDMVKNIAIDDGIVTVSVELPSPICTESTPLMMDIREELFQIPGVENVNIRFDFKE